MPLTSYWTLLISPVAGGIIGYFTNDLAIRMLFRPYRAIYIGGRKLPFTPGLIPQNQERLAQRIADAILGSLLTPEELQNLARRLLATERMQAAILWLLRVALDQIRDDTEQKTARILSGILRDLLSQSLPRLLRVLARREDFLETQLNQIFDQVLLDLQLNEAQASQLSEWLLDIVLPPDNLRDALVSFLTDRNIEIIDEGFREKASGTYWVVANLFGARNALQRLRTFCIEEQGEANRRIADLILALGVRQRLIELLQNLSLQNLPVATVRQLRRAMRESVRTYIREQGAELLQGFSETVDWNGVAVLLLNRLRNSTVVNSSLEVVSQELALILDRYLEKDLEAIVAKAIPILDLDRVIVDRVKATTPASLEEAIQGIVQKELQAIVNLGGVLGVLVGVVQALLLLAQS
ncbi:DUF445 domain-containing protein [Leptolyngbya sp. FACHB-261]|uniref:DUF445 domain-containing protein n=1 Tax=Leptolyngbya sp. FACHB-261 TaxID=2692806 RepID=UPI0016887AE9|nr:DUF445 family protein [Leptolyngbya sp. FACHB-261]MBD2104789.1 DUF445 family protein [Leptolyngbya sp. FACHB-261]